MNHKAAVLTQVIEAPLRAEAHLTFGVVLVVHPLLQRLEGVRVGVQVVQVTRHRRFVLTCKKDVRKFDHSFWLSVWTLRFCGSTVLCGSFLVLHRLVDAFHYLSFIAGSLESAYWLLRGALNILSQEMLRPLWQFYGN